MYFDPEEWNPVHCRDCEYYRPTSPKCGWCTLENHETEGQKSCKGYEQARF